VPGRRRRAKSTRRLSRSKNARKPQCGFYAGGESICDPQFDAAAQVALPRGCYRVTHPGPIKDDANTQPLAEIYKREALIPLKRTWSELYSTEAAQFSTKLGTIELAVTATGTAPRDSTADRASCSAFSSLPLNRATRRTIWLVREAAAGEAVGIAFAVARAVSGNGHAL